MLAASAAPRMSPVCHSPIERRSHGAAHPAAAAMEGVMSYRVILPTGADARVVLPKLMLLQEEDPQLLVVWNERLGEVH